MRRYLAIAAAALSLLASPASADWTGKNAAGATITFSNPVDCTIGTCIPIAAMVNAAGATLYGTAGTANASVLTVQGIASMTPFLSAQSGTWTVQPGNTANTTPWLFTGSGTAGSPAAGVVTVQGAASMTPLFMQSATVPVSTMNAANAANLGVANAYVFDDTSPTAITENNFGYARMSANRNVYQTIRDAAGNERGANVDASNRLTTAPTMVSGSVASGAIASGAVASGAIASGAVASGAYASGSIASGAMVDLGAQADAVCGTDTGTCSLIALQKRNNAQLTAVGTSPLPAQANTTTNIGMVNVQAAANGGASTTGNIAANNTTAVVVKASAGTLYGVQLAGLGSAPAYLKIYNATSATCGSGTPVKRLMIPAASTAANGAGSNITFGVAGVAFSTGITYCITTGIGDSDTTAPAASTFLVNLDWS